MFRTLYATATRKAAASILAPATVPTLALVPVATERAEVKGYSYGRNALRASAIAARAAERARWS